MGARGVAMWLALALAAGCGHQNFYKQYFVDLRNAHGHLDLEPPNGPLAITKRKGPKDANSDSSHMLEAGFVQLGYSDFWCTDCGTSQVDLDSFGRSIGAQSVFVYDHTLSKSVDYYVEPVLSGFEDGTSSGAATCNGEGVCETQTTATTHAVYTNEVRAEAHNKEHFGVMFWAKAKPDPLGVLVRDLTNDEKSRAGVPAVMIYAVVRGSPAASAVLGKNWVITSIGDTPTGDSAAFHAQVLAHVGQRVTIRGRNNHGPFAIEVALGPAPR